MKRITLALAAALALLATGAFAEDAPAADKPVAKPAATRPAKKAKKAKDAAKAAAAKEAPPPADSK